MEKVDTSLLKLIQRSADIGDGWRQVNDLLWPSVLEYKDQDLIDLDHENKCVRVSAEGLIVLKYS
jgi:hypothetical protein